MSPYAKIWSAYRRCSAQLVIRTQPIPCSWRKGSLSGDECHPLEPIPCGKGQSEGMAVIPWALIPCVKGQSGDGQGLAVPWPRGWVP